MTTIEELTNETLTITFRRSLFERITCFLGSILCFVFAVCILLWGGGDVSGSTYPAFAALFLILLELGFLAAGAFLISRIFDTIIYHFDKTDDKFCVRPRKYLFKRRTTEGMVSEITDVSYEIFGTDENTSSEIYLKFRPFGNIVETLKCGTRDVGEDDNIADTIQRFLRVDDKK